jgi:hypothetical protein
MLCEICGVREATIHKTAPNLNISTVAGKPASICHYCTGCFETMFRKSGKAEEPENEEKTPVTPTFD